MPGKAKWLFVAALWGVTQNLVAADNVWTNTAGGKWETAANWSLLAAPTSSQSALWITNTPAKIVRFDSATPTAARTISNLILGVTGSPNSLVLSNAGTSTPLLIRDLLTNDVGSSISISNSILRVQGIQTNDVYNDGSITLLNLGQLILTNVFTSVAIETNASLTIRGGTAQIGDLGIGETDVGTLTVSGGTLSLLGDLSSGLYVGDYEGGTGAVWVTGGTVLLTNDVTFVGFAGAGTFTVSNVTVQTSDFIVGELGTGTLRVGSGTLSVSASGFGALIAGDFDGSTGNVWVTGGQLLVPSDATTIGNDGVGQLTVSNGTVSINDVTVGNFGVGTLAVAGGVVTLGAGEFTNLVCGSFYGSTGIVQVTGGQLLAGAVSTFIANEGEARMTINAGTVSSRDVWVGNFFGSSGTLTVAGGTNTLSSLFSLGVNAGARGAAWVTSGLLSVLNGTSVIGSNGIASLTMSNGAVRMSSVFLAPQAGAGSITVAGGVMTIYSGLTLGNCALGGSGTLTVTGGSVFITNKQHNAVLDVRKGTVSLSGGTMFVDQLIVTNSCGHFVQIGGTLGTNIVILTSSLDADGDGIPNGWEQQYRLDPLNPGDAASDPDGDGFSTLQEYLAGTIPTNGASQFQISSVTREGNNVRVTWTTVPGKKYTLQRSGFPGAYTDIFNVTNTTTSTTNYLDTGVVTFPARFYRTKLVP